MKAVDKVVCTEIFNDIITTKSSEINAYKHLVKYEKRYSVKQHILFKIEELTEEIESAKNGLNNL